MVLEDVSGLHEQTQRANMRITRRGDVPAGRAKGIPVHFQSNIVPAIRHENSETLPGVDTAAIQQEPGVRVGISGIGKLDLFDMFHIPLANCILSFLVIS